MQAMEAAPATCHNYLAINTPDTHDLCMAFQEGSVFKCSVFMIFMPRIFCLNLKRTVQCVLGHSQWLLEQRNIGAAWMEGFVVLLLLLC
jgi:hypothetical protein